MEPLLPQPVEIRVANSTYIKTLVFAAVALLLWQMLPMILLFYVALLLAAVFMPVVKYLEKTRLGRGTGVFISAILLLALLSSVIFLLMPALAEQISNLTTNLPKVQSDILNSVPEGTPRSSLEKLFSFRSLQNSEKLVGHLMVAGEYALGGLSSFLLILIFSVYILADGPRAFEWIVAFFGEEDRRKCDQSSREISDVMFAYVIGQGLTSLACGVYAFIVLSCLHVPAALTLALLAGIFDILPVLGFFCSGIPAVLLALSVSTSTALWVFVAYVLYHVIENYFLVPKIYGNRLQLSGLAVLAAFLLGGIVGGIMGAVAILPLVASYPVIEKIWLKKYIRPRTLEVHAAT
ncbi:MAG: AI-2E family transporter [Bdellovibrionota bacterium]